MRHYHNIHEFIRDYEKKNPAGHYFDRKTLKFFGERLSGIRIFKRTEKAVDFHNREHECYVVSMIQHNNPDGPKRMHAYFDVNTLEDISPLMTYSKR